MAHSPLVMKALALVLFTATVAANCPHKRDWKSLEGRTSERDITSGSQNRTYLLHIPQGFSKTKDKVGFVFFYHEESKDAYYQERISGFSDRALNNKYVAVYPQATNGTWCSGRSSGGNYSDDLTMNSQDHIYTSAILDELFATRGLCLDSTQAYATGLGNGSSFMFHLNCYNVHNPPFQAFAGVAGIPQTLDMSPDRCFHAGFKPLLMIHGTDDNERTKLKARTPAT
jgi:poly(3-hydroxybutyrate) depolymerase